MSAFDTLTCMPARVTSGDRVAISLVTLAATYPAPEFSLSVIMRAGATAPITTNLDAVATGVLDFSSASAGLWSWSIKATRVSDGAVRTVQTGSITVDPDPSSQDTRTHAEKVLASIEALIEGRATKDVSTYSIAGRSLTRMSPQELIEWRSVYRAEVAKQRNAGKPNGGRIIRLASFRP